MKRQLVFVPVSAAELNVMDGGDVVLPRPAYTVTSELLDELGYTAKETEDAEYAALVLASVAGLATYGTRLVVVAEVDSALVGQGDDPLNGQVVLSDLPSRSITAWFTDEPGTDVSDAALISHDLTIDEVWETHEVQELLAHDLLWNDVVEYRREKRN